MPFMAFEMTYIHDVTNYSRHECAVKAHAARLWNLSIESIQWTMAKFSGAVHAHRA